MPDIATLDILGAITITDRPVDAEAPEGARWFFTIWASAGAMAVLPWAILLVRRGNPWLLLMVVGAVVASFLEPMLDTLIHLWYPTNLPFTAYSAFGIHIPLLVPPAYVFFGGVTAYGVYRLIERGLTFRQFFVLEGALLVSDLILEYPGILTDAYIYYGEQPFQLAGFPWWVTIPASTAVLIMGFLLWWLAPRLRGPQKLLVVLVPPIGIGASYGAVAWPGMLAVNADLPGILTWGLAALCLLPALAITWAIASTVATDRGKTTAQFPDPMSIASEPQPAATPPR
ncbi:MAG: hypothetical protein WD844_11770 [Thermoleophilaceae bacterium]